LAQISAMRWIRWSVTALVAAIGLLVMAMVGLRGLPARELARLATWLAGAAMIIVALGPPAVALSRRKTPRGRSLRA
jgi:hypothetical protein